MRNHFSSWPLCPLLISLPSAAALLSKRLSRPWTSSLLQQISTSHATTRPSFRATSNDYSTKRRLGSSHVRDVALKLCSWIDTRSSGKTPTYGPGFQSTTSNLSLGSASRLWQKASISPNTWVAHLRHPPAADQYPRSQEPGRFPRTEVAAELRSPLKVQLGVMWQPQQALHPSHISRLLTSNLGRFLLGVVHELLP